MEALLSVDCESCIQDPVEIVSPTNMSLSLTDPSLPEKLQPAPLSNSRQVYREKNLYWPPSVWCQVSYSWLCAALS